MKNGPTGWGFKTKILSTKTQTENSIERIQASLPLADRSFVPVPANRGQAQDRVFGCGLNKIEAKKGQKKKGGDQGGMEQKFFVILLHSFANRRRRL